jgi:hypothetical protein
MPPRQPEDKPSAAEARGRRSGWVIATADLYIGGQPGTGSLPQLAHRAGERLTASAATANGWTDDVRPE